MKLQQFLAEKKEDSKETLKLELMDFFKENPNPPDDEVHKFAENKGIDAHELEAAIYSILGSFLSAGRSKDFTGEYDPKEMKMGLKIEMEHTTDPKIAEKITKDHLAEFPNYYTALTKMEDGLKSK